MRSIAKLSCVAGLAAAFALTLSSAYAQSRNYVYGADRAPYAAHQDQDNPRDFQLQGTH